MVQRQSKKKLITPERAGSREWWGLAIIALPCLLYSMDFTVLHLAVPSIVNDLKPTSAQLLWIIDIYGFLLAGALITMGVLGDRIGRRKLLLIGAVVFGLASILTAFAPTAEMLIVARALLGLAAATLAPSTLSLIRNMFVDPKQRGFAISIWVASFSAGAALGPLIGGVLLNYFWWGSVFLIAVPVSLLLLLLGPRLLPEYRDPHPGRLDVTSAGLSLVAILSMVYGIKQFAAGEGNLWSVAAILAGMGVAAIFLRRQQTLKKPFINLSLFRSRTFSAMLIIYMMVLVVNFVAFLFIAQYLQLVLGMGALEAGLWTLPWGVGFIVGSLATSRLASRIRPTFVMAGSMMVAALGFFLLTQLEGGLAVIVIGSTLFSLGLAPPIALATDLIIGTVPPERAGMASGLSETASELGGALGIALIGSAATALYRGQLEHNLPADIAPHDAEVSLETLGGAITVADQLPGAISNQLTTAALDAFTNSVILGFTLCGICILAVSLLTLAIAQKLKQAETKMHAD
jgi:MFS transporter, DHA2 family, multidrug resistance protein